MKKEEAKQDLKEMGVRGHSDEWRDAGVQGGLDEVGN